MRTSFGWKEKAGMVQRINAGSASKTVKSRVCLWNSLCVIVFANPAFGLQYYNKRWWCYWWALLCSLSDKLYIFIYPLCCSVELSTVRHLSWVICFTWFAVHDGEHCSCSVDRVCCQSTESYRLQGQQCMIWHSRSQPLNLHLAVLLFGLISPPTR